MSLELDAATTALIVIDLQKGITSRGSEPYSSDEVVTRSAKLADVCRAAGATVILVHVGFHADDRDRLKSTADAPPPLTTQIPPDFSEFVPQIGPKQDDLVMMKRQWGAFYGTDLDLQLRRRGIKTIILCGISTNFGVESTARDAWERNYEIIFAEDAMAGFTADAHRFAVGTIFPRLGRIRMTADIIEALS